MTRVEFVAHRGESYDAPENTLAAFRLAWARGCRAIELDVHQTADGRLIVCHDSSARRTTGVDLVIEETRYELLRALDAGSWKSPQWAGERMPDLVEALALVPDGRRCLVEVKGGPDCIPLLARDLRAAAIDPAKVVVISFDVETVAEAVRTLPRHETRLLAAFRAVGEAWEPRIDSLIRTAREAGTAGLGLCAQPPVTAEAAARIHAAGLGVHVWTIDDVEPARTFMVLGVDSITSNRAAWLAEQCG